MQETLSFSIDSILDCTVAAYNVVYRKIDHFFRYVLSGPLRKTSAAYFALATNFCSFMNLFVATLFDDAYA